MSDKSHCYLVITELFLPTKGGTAVWFDEVYKRIGGREIHIVTADVPGAAEYDQQHTNAVHRVSLKRHWWLRPESLAMYAKLFLKAFRVALTNKIDAVHAGRVLPEGLVGLIVARIFRKPLVIYAHGEEITTWRQSGKFKVMVLTYCHADIVIANSDFTRDELLKLGIKDERIIIINPGVDVDRFKPGLEVKDLHAIVGLQSEQKLILSVGRLSRRKGFDNVIRALAELVDQGINIRYAIIGIGEDEEYLKKLVKEYAVTDSVSFLGHVTPEDLPRWYNACDVFAMPNREMDGDTEGFGMVFLEAAACEKPSIAGNAGGTGSAVIDGVTGLRVDGDDQNAIVGALKKIMVDNLLASSMGSSGFDRVHSSFTWKKVALKTTEIFPNGGRSKSGNSGENK